MQSKILHNLNFSNIFGGKLNLINKFSNETKASRDDSNAEVGIHFQSLTCCKVFGIWL